MRIFLQYVLPFIAPLVIYLLWFVLWGRRHGRVLPDWKSGPWFWLIIAGFVLAVGGLLFMGLTTGHDPGGDYQSPRYKDGRVVPGDVR